MYKLIAIDLDGTLLNDNKEISDKNNQVIRAALKKGYKIVFATGRRYLAAKGFIDGLDQDLVIIANNGNMVRHTRNDELLSHSYLDKAYLGEILNKGKALGLNPTLHVNKFDQGIDMVHEMEKDHPSYFNYLINESRLERIKDFTSENLDILSLVYLGDYNKLRDLYDYVSEEYGEFYQIYLMNNIVLADGLLEIVNKQSNKWTSILDYAQGLGIERKEIIAIGDDANDITMIREAGLGVAMANGIEATKQVADIISELDNNNSGLGHVLERILAL